MVEYMYVEVGCKSTKAFTSARKLESLRMKKYPGHL